MKKLTYLPLILGLMFWEVATRVAALPPNSQDHLIARGTFAAVALTFDDGPQPVFTPRILQVLERYGVRATFFDVGSLVQEYPGLVRQTREQGHVVGNHSWNHSDLTTLSPDAIRSQLRSTSTVIQQATGVAPTLFRPPYGATNATVKSIAAQLGLVEVGWTVDARDWQRPGVATLVSTILTSVRPGSIIVLHDGGGDRSQTVQALPQIIRGLKLRGFTFTTL